MQTDGKAINILLKEASIAIRYRMMSKSCEENNTADYFKLKSELENSEKVKRMITYLANHKEYHGATLYAAENSLNILIDMGLLYGVGFSEFDNILEKLACKVKERKIEESHVLRYLPDIVMIPFLLRAGVRESWMTKFVRERIDVIYDFIKQRNYDIYDDINIYKGIPKNFQGRPIIRPELCEKGQIKLPLEYDIYGLASIYDEVSKDYKKKIDEIIIYIMDKNFQRIADTYGVLTDKKNYWALGWDPKPTDLEKEYCYNPLLLKMMMDSIIILKIILQKKTRVGYWATIWEWEKIVGIRMHLYWKEHLEH